jgi:hypothetical protein
VPLFGAFVVGLESVMRMRVYFGAYIWSLYKFWSLYLVPLFGAYIWCLYLVPLLYLVPIIGAYIWSLYLVPLFGAFIWCLYLVPLFGASCVGARGAFIWDLQ